MVCPFFPVFHHHLVWFIWHKAFCYKQVVVLTGHHFQPSFHHLAVRKGQGILREVLFLEGSKWPSPNGLVPKFPFHNPPKEWNWNTWKSRNWTSRCSLCPNLSFLRCDPNRKKLDSLGIGWLPGCTKDVCKPTCIKSQPSLCFSMFFNWIWWWIWPSLRHRPQRVWNCLQQFQRICG